MICCSARCLCYSFNVCCFTTFAYIFDMVVRVSPLHIKFSMLTTCQLSFIHANMCSYETGFLRVDLSDFRIMCIRLHAQLLLIISIYAMLVQKTVLQDFSGANG